MHKNSWDSVELDWSLVLPPSKPGVSDLNLMHDWLANSICGSRVCILGSTPEYRDFAVYNNALSVTIIEKSKVAYDTFSAGKVLSFKNEKVIWGNWLDILPLLSGEFDIILGDLVSGNVPYKRQGFFYESIFNALKPQGFFYERILVTIEPLLDINSLMKNFSIPPYNLHRLTEFVNKFYFLSSILKGQSEIRPEYIKNYILSNSPSLFVQKFLKDSEKLLPMNGVWYYSLGMMDVSRCCHEKFANFFQREVSDDSIFGKKIERRLSRRR